ncbi:MAG TPA: amino acid adenylation domain-containing protein, partial [Pilimelia sp.]|nr:amino acid adenylation domain-containing protein [Pilimelia sp.]
SFRTRDGAPVQVVDPAAAPVLSRHDVSGHPVDAREAAAAAIARAETDRPFDLGAAPLLRATLIRVGERDHLLVLCAHHIVCDDLSLGIVVRELLAAYPAVSSGRPPELGPAPVQFPDFVHWDAGRREPDRIRAHEAYWRRQLAGAPTLLELPTDRPRPPAARLRGDARGFDLSPELSAAVASAARRSGGTPFMVLLAAFQVLLARYSGQDDIVVGAPVANREMPEVESAVGMFVETVVLRADLAGNPTAGDTLARVRETCLDGLAHAEFGLDRVLEVVRPAREASHNPLIQVMFVLNPAPAAPSVSELDVRPVPMGTVPARFDLTLVLTEGSGGYAGRIDYDTDLFDAATIDRMAASLRRILAALVADPGVRIHDIPLLDDAQLRALAGAEAAPAVEAYADELIAQQAARTPAAAAVTAGGETLSYRELDRRANDLAWRLREAGIGPEERVALALRAGTDAMAGLLGILKAGAAYVPLDPADPPARLAATLADTGARILVTAHRFADRFPDFDGTVIDPAGIEVDGLRAVAPPPIDRRPEHLAYVIYTSGSTGEPKGVMVTHATLARFAVSFRDRHGFGPDQRLLMLPPLSFDASVGDIFPALISGATLVVHPDPAALSGRELLRWCAEHRITAVDTASALWQHWVDDLADGAGPLDGAGLLDGADTAGAVPPEALPSMVMVGGDSVRLDTLRRWARATGGRIAFYNHYGPTEATVCATTYETVDGSEAGESGTLPIGRPLPGVRTYVLDRWLRPVPVGVPGELWIGGDCLARGYLGRPGLTAERFVPDPFADRPGQRLYRTGDLVRVRPDSQLEFIGRADRQVKIRGRRVEPGEVEACLARHPGVAETVVVARDLNTDAARLVAYVVPRTAHAVPRTAVPVTAAALGEHVRAHLPAALLPGAYVILDALPLTRHGKVDLDALPAPDPAAARPPYVAPRSDVEARIAAMWAEALGVPEVGVHDDFFSLGGHSLLATSVMPRIAEEFGVSLPVRALVEAADLGDFAAAVARAGDSGAPAAGHPDVPDLRAEAVLPDDVCADLVPAPPGAAGAVLLTAATGSLGGRLLADLLHRTDARVYCLVRAASCEAAAERLRRALEHLGEWRPEYATRLVAVPGDVSQPRLGLAVDRYADLSESVETVYHIASLVNVVHPYRRLKPANVTGTVEVLRFAGHLRVKPVHHVSTLGVFLGTAYARRLVRETDIPDDPTGIASGFAQSKWVADALARAARDRGLPVTIYRPARISGDSRTGEYRTDDLFCRLLHSYVEVGCAPEAGPAIDMTPVDHLAAAIGYLSRQPGSANRDFHFHNARTLPVSAVPECLRDAGFDVVAVPAAEWGERVRAAAARGEAGTLAPFAGYALPIGPDSPRFDCGDTEAALTRGGLSCPSADTVLLRRYVDHLIRTGFLPAPTPRSRDAAVTGA